MLCRLAVNSSFSGLDGGLAETALVAGARHSRQASPLGAP